MLELLDTDLSNSRLMIKVFMFQYSSIVTNVLKVKILKILMEINIFSNSMCSLVLLFSCLDIHLIWLGKAQRKPFLFVNTLEDFGKSSQNVECLLGSFLLLF